MDKLEPQLLSKQSNEAPLRLEGEWCGQRQSSKMESTARPRLDMKDGVCFSMSLAGLISSIDCNLMLLSDNYHSSVLFGCWGFCESLSVHHICYICLHFVVLPLHGNYSLV